MAGVGHKKNADDVAIEVLRAVKQRDTSLLFQLAPENDKKLFRNNRALADKAFSRFVWPLVSERWANSGRILRNGFEAEIKWDNILPEDDNQITAYIVNTDKGPYSYALGDLIIQVACAKHIREVETLFSGPKNLGGAKRLAIARHGFLATDGEEMREWGITGLLPISGSTGSWSQWNSYDADCLKRFHCEKEADEYVAHLKAESGK